MSISADDSQSEESVLSSYLELSRCYLKIDFDSAEIYINRGIKLAFQTNQQKYIAAFMVQKGDRAYDLGKMDTALNTMGEAIQLYGKLDKDRDYLKALNVTGLIHETRQDYENALKYYLMGLNEAKLQKDTLNLAFFCNNSSLIYKMTGDSVNAFKHIKKAMELFKSINNQSLYSNALVNIANFYKDAGRYQKAAEYLQKAKRIQIELGNHYGLFNTYGNLGDIAIASKDTNLALDYYFKSYEHYKKCDTLSPLLNYEVAFIFIDFAKVYYLQGQYDLSINYFNKVVKEGINQRSLILLSSGYQGLSDCYQKLGKPDSALHYMMLNLPVHDSLIKEKYNVRIDQLNFNFQLAKEKELSTKEKELLRVDHKRKELVYIIILIGLMFLLLLFVSIYFFLKNKMKQNALLRKSILHDKEKAEKELEYKNKQLTTNVMYLIRKNELIENISEELKNSILGKEKNNQKLIEGLIYELDKSSSNDLWKEFEVRFHEVHGDFYNRLIQNYPNLTPNELKLCAFLYLKMSTKEIASITYQSHESLRTARYRLRKKLGISRDENLVSFLTQV